MHCKTDLYVVQNLLFCYQTPPDLVRRFLKKITINIDVVYKKVKCLAACPTSLFLLESLQTLSILKSFGCDLIGYSINMICTCLWFNCHECLLSFITLMSHALF